MNKTLKPVLGIIVVTLLTVVVARTLTKAETRKSMNMAAVSPASASSSTTVRPAAPAATLTDIEKTLGFVPHFLSDIPAAALPGTWEEMKSLQLNDKTALPPKIKELIGLGVAAQIPCMYCVQAHTEFARKNGATEAEIGQAVAEAGLTRHWSTFANGMNLDENRFRADITRAVTNMKKMKASGAAMPKPIDVVDGRTALLDIQQTYGFVPDFIQRFPDVARAGAWKSMRDVEMNPNGALPGKYVSLISLGVAAQIPCKFCIFADGEFAKMDGATDAEIAEAVAMASLTRQISTYLNGMQTDPGLFKSDIARIVKGSQASAPPATAPAPTQVR